MSLITRCPACATQFKVVPDQLKLSDGWVRCGHCSDVFDATRYLETWAPGATAPKPSADDQASLPLGRERFAQPSLSVAQSTGMETAEASSQLSEAAPMAFSPGAVPAALHADDLDMDLTFDEAKLPFCTDQAPSSEADGHTAVSQVVPAGSETVDRHAERESNFHTELQRFAAGQGKPPESDSLDESKVPAAPSLASVSSPAVAAQEAKLELSPSPDGQEPVAAGEPDFVRQARRRAFWRSPSVRALLTLLVLLLSALLAGQWAIQERDRLAARHPSWLALMASACEPLGCSIGALRDLQAVVIDSSTLTRRLGDFYSFDLVLKNTSALALATPALELSLTDTADSVISRRVFLPADLPGVPPLLPPRSTVPVSLRLSLAVGSELPMAGYRALVFYP